jgi:hypothetical protein
MEKDVKMCKYARERVWLYHALTQKQGNLTSTQSTKPHNPENAGGAAKYNLPEN